ncbi:RB8NL protein, partial [Urocolius indicus]|nr:RB8NL protein [Urocolius indicus]
MTTESFAEFLNKLKEIHEKEVQGLQSKLTELTTEKCRDAHRIEELFAKNHQLREQQKVLKENVKVLENRLRAGLCDRCMVTQELAKKKQNEYENSHFQSLQHIFILTNETNRLREENKSLKEELKRLRSLETKPSGITSRESSCSPSSPLALLSPVSRNTVSEQVAHRGADEAHHDVPGLQLGEEKPAAQRSSPSSRTSPSTVLQEVSLAEIASQRISNQLHGTIALVRPGSRPCLLERSPSRPTVSPPPRKTPVPREPSPSLEAYLPASKPDSPKLSPSYENLKVTSRREQLCLLHKHLSLHQRGLGSNCASAERDGSSLSSHVLRAKDGAGWLRSREEDRAALLKLPAMVYVRDQHLEEKLHLLKHRERLQHFLMQQCQAGQRADEDSKPVPEERPLSPWPSILLGCKKEKSFPEDAAGVKEEKELWLSRDGSELREKAKAARDDGADVPLDLSESGRGRERSWHKAWEPRGTGSPQPSPSNSPAVPVARGHCGRHGAERDDLHSPCHWPNTTQALPGAVEEEDAAVLSRAQPTNNFTPSDPEASPETQARLAASTQMGKAGKKFRAKVTCVEGKSKRYDDGAESGKQESDEPDTTDSEVAASYEDETPQEAQDDAKYFCTKDKAQVLQKKRKRGQDPWTKGAKKSMRGRKKIKVEQGSAEITKEPENCSASLNNTSEES